MITRKEMFQDLIELLKDTDAQESIAGGLKCVCSALETSKSYLNSRNAKK